MSNQVELEYIGGGRHFVPGYPARDLTVDQAMADHLLAYQPPVYRRKSPDRQKEGKQ